MFGERYAIRGLRDWMGVPASVGEDGRLLAGLIELQLQALVCSYSVEAFNETECILVIDRGGLEITGTKDLPEAHLAMRDFRIEDLLFRSSVDLGNSLFRHFYEGKTVLVTGGGGSIGSELCRQIAANNPKRLIILDIYENNAYEIQQELIRRYGHKLNLEVVIASVRDKNRLEDIFRRERPQLVFHAAAHKHVPLMESSGVEALKNNVLGTYNTANMRSSPVCSRSPRSPRQTRRCRPI